MMNCDNIDISNLTQVEIDFLNIFMSIHLDSSIDTSPIDEYFSNPNNIVQEVLSVGHLSGRILKIQIPDKIHMDIDLCVMLNAAITQSKFNLVNLLLKNDIMLDSIQPRIMTLLASVTKSDINPLFNHSIGTQTIYTVQDLIFHQIHRSTNISVDNYACFYLWVKAKCINIIKLIMGRYIFSEDVATELVGRSCVIAIKEDDVQMIEYLMPVSTIPSILELVYDYSKNGIIFCDCVNVIKYYVENGMDLSRNGYELEHMANSYGRKNVLEFIQSKKID